MIYTSLPVIALAILDQVRIASQALETQRSGQLLNGHSVLTVILVENIALKEIL